MDAAPEPPLPLWQKAIRTLLAIALAAVVTAAIGTFIGVTATYLVIACYGDRDHQLTIVTANSLGALQVSDGPVVENIVFEPDEWKAFLAIWRTVRAGASRVPKIGDVDEIGLPPRSHLKFVAGKEIVRFQISHGGRCAQYDLPAKYLADFDRSLEATQRYLDGGPLPNGASPMPMSTEQRLKAAYDTYLGAPETPKNSCDDRSEK
jgi:hypothetical protein